MKLIGQNIYHIAKCEEYVNEPSLMCVPGVNFINVFCAAYTRADPKSVKLCWRLDWAIMLTGYVRLIAVRRMLMKLTPGIISRESLKINFLSIKCGKALGEWSTNWQKGVKFWAKYKTKKSCWTKIDGLLSFTFQDFCANKSLAC